MSSYVVKKEQSSNIFQRKIYGSYGKLTFGDIFMGVKTKIMAMCAVLSVIMPLLFINMMAKVLKPIPIEEKKESETRKEKQSLNVSVLDQSGNVVSMEFNDYLLGVLLCEMPADFEMEALKAQAVAARTYALRRLYAGDKHDDAAVCMDSSCCHGYISPKEYQKNGGTKESVERMQTAVEETDSEVLLYQGELIEATYFSCSGGMTEDAVAVWGTEIPYLQSKESPGEEQATHYTDTLQFSKSEISERLGVTLTGDSNTWFKIKSYTDGGGVDVIEVCGVAFTGVEIRKKLNLRSTIFTITAIGDTVTITTKGYGHRVGMSQYGAEAMALQGYGYQEILRYYYEGTDLSRIPANN